MKNLKTILNRVIYTVIDIAYVMQSGHQEAREILFVAPWFKIINVYN